MNKSKTKTKLSSGQHEDLLGILRTRFEKNMRRHEGLTWVEVLVRLEAHPEKCWSLHEMEESGGEPDVVGQDAKSGEIFFVDCSAESVRRQLKLVGDDN